MEKVYHNDLKRLNSPDLSSVGYVMDILQAVEWYTKSANQGCDNAKSTLKKLSKHVNKITSVKNV
ncbi:hypothetical protein AN639_03225 [Candidatus Epulonipiscium fishelsonii]|uniref:Uncharacterized protein n=1 Tax=Candidatus Epulonipiscium fishelsonii TaxID=77094 RepID=A0ACC8XH39_9FIRM|nr:hypothetical protein AN639_03225 [Epulopiscium sp. SCG-B05WGA-EpuloA1]ONI42628.1 hypothetical protein AN396_13680 [Epulopiscium sp. SCG-B11WGA-EpuloA1]